MHQEVLTILVNYYLLVQGLVQFVHTIEAEGHKRQLLKNLVNTN